MSVTRNEAIRAQVLYVLRKVRAGEEITLDVEKAYDLLVELIGQHQNIPPKVWAFVLEAYSRVLAKDNKWPQEPSA